MNRWIEITSTTRTGKALFICRYCGNQTPAPTTECKNPPVVNDAVYERTCFQLEVEERGRLIHPIHRTALLRLSSLLDQLLEAKSKRAGRELLRADRNTVLAVVKGAIMRRGTDDTLRIWDVNDDIEDIRKELDKK